MKTCIFIFWISFLVLFSHGVLSKSPTNKELYSIDSENSNENSEIDVGKQGVALHDESFRPRHKHKGNGHRTRFYRSIGDSDKDQEIKAPHCAVMYKDNEPVGILQPFKESYRFLPVSGDPTLVDINPIPVKRKTIMDVLYPNKISGDYNDEIPEDNSQFADDRYPSIFAKFKIDSRLDRSSNPDLNLKRSMYKRDKEKPDISDEQVSSLKTTLSKMKGDNSAVVEEELKNILDDMGLIDDYDDREVKREIAEDENMEQGTNKINLVKEEHNDTRNKRGEVNATTEKAQNGTATTQSALTTTVVVTTVAVPTKVGFEEERTEEMDSIDLFKDDSKLDDDAGKEDLDVSTETEGGESRKKRQFETDDTKGGAGKEVKRDITDTLPDVNLSTSGLVKEGELSRYEKRVEREIRDKIQKLKEEVKEEIKNLKKNNEVSGGESDTRRRKRQVINTLMEEETRDIDPNFNGEGQNEGHHVRRKRSLHFGNWTTLGEPEIINNLVKTVNFKEKPNFGNNSNVTRLENNKQKINENKKSLRSTINFAQINPTIVETIKSQSEETEISVPGLTKIKALIDGKIGTKNNMIPNEDTSNKKCLMNVYKDKTEIDNVDRVRFASNKMDAIKSKNASFETKRKKNIIKILNVIGKKKYNYTQNLPKKRFIGVNPILENTTHFTDHYYMKNFTRYAKDGTKTAGTEDSMRSIIVNTTLNNAANSTNHYNSRSLKQFDEEKIENGIHVMKKRSDEPDDRVNNDSTDRVNIRIKRQTKEDSEENDYQYDNAEFNEDSAIENQAYDDQPYANENDAVDNPSKSNNALISNVDSNCNCDKTDSGCKCGTQKNGMSVPNIKQDYSDYMEDPSNLVEKKSINNCHCDKNGKHCKCQTFREGSEYSDDAEEQPVEKSADLEEDAVLDEVQSGVRERIPRRLRHRRKHATHDLTNLNAENLADEDYYGNYETDTGRLMKREAKLREREEKQQFQNGEYFVDLHPYTYRLTPIEPVREKRDNFKDLIAIHSGGPVMNHLVAIRQRSMLPHSRIRRRIQNDDNKEPRQLIDMSDEDIFGALPQSFAGELARYKRVKRGKAEK